MTQWVIDYYQKIAPKILPFLKDRPVGIRQIFNGEMVFRRHAKDGKSFIFINSQKDLDFWVRWHGWGYFPHLEGKKDTWFCLDIDQRKMSDQAGIIAAQTMCQILDNKKIKYLLKYSGSNGWHFLWNFGKIPNKISGQKIWQIEQKIIEKLQDLLENHLQKSAQKKIFEKFLKAGDPITIKNAMDQEHKNSILIDELILKEKATIRAPWSLHEKSKLVSVPITPADLIKFNPRNDAAPSNTLKIKKDFFLPKNDLKKILKNLT